MRSRILLIILAINLGPTVPAHAGKWLDKCRTLLAGANRTSLTYENSSFKERIETFLEEQKNRVEKAGIVVVKEQNEVRLVDVRGNSIASLDYFITDRTVIGPSPLKTLIINNIYVNDYGYRNKGLAKYILAVALRDNLDVMRIGGELRSTNISAYHDALKRNIDPNNAVREMPAYKLRKFFGFTEVESYDGLGIFNLQGFYMRRAY